MPAPFSQITVFMESRCGSDSTAVYPHYDMSLIDLPDGGKAWVCDNIKWAIYPERYAELQESRRNYPAGKLLSEILGDDDGPKD